MFYLKENSMTAVVEKQEIKAPPAEVVAMAEIIAKGLTVKGKEVQASDDFLNGVYFDTMPQKLNRELAEELNAHKKTFAAASGLAVGNVGLGLYKKHKDMEDLTVTFGMEGKDKWVVQSKRHTTHPNPQDRTKSVESYGSIKGILETNLGSKTSGQFGAVSRYLKETAAEALRDL